MPNVKKHSSRVAKKRRPVSSKRLKLLVKDIGSSVYFRLKKTLNTEYTIKLSTLLVAILLVLIAIQYSYTSGRESGLKVNIGQSSDDFGAQQFGQPPAGYKAPNFEIPDVDFDTRSVNKPPVGLDTRNLNQPSADVNTQILKKPSSDFDMPNLGKVFAEEDAEGFPSESDNTNFEQPLAEENVPLQKKLPAEFNTRNLKQPASAVSVPKSRNVVSQDDFEEEPVSGLNTYKKPVPEQQDEFEFDFDDDDFLN